MDPDKRSCQERRFMLQFCYLSNLIIRDQTLRSATSFGNIYKFVVGDKQADINKITEASYAGYKETGLFP